MNDSEDSTTTYGKLQNDCCVQNQSKSFVTTLTNILFPVPFCVFRRILMDDYVVVQRDARLFLLKAKG